MGVHRCIAVVRTTVGGDAEQLDMAEQVPTVELPHTGGVQAAAAAAHDDGDVYVPPAGPVDGDPDQASPEEVTEDLVPTVALGGVETSPEPAHTLCHATAAL